MIHSSRSVAPADGEQLVGRSDELAVLRDAAVRSAAGEPQVVMVLGPAGVGKSALLRSFRRELDGARVVAVAADELADHVSMALIDQVTSLRSDDAFTAGLELVEHLASRQTAGPVALLVEDLHWADERSRQILLSALRRLGRGDAVLVVVTSRDDGSLVRDGWDRFVDDPQRCRRLELGSLSLSDVSLLASSCGVTLGPSARRNLRDQTGGHALYVRTLLRELTAEQLRSSAPLPAPRSLAATTVAMLDDVSTGGAELLRVLAVLGGTAPLTQLTRVGAVDDPVEALEAALTTGLIEWRTDGAEQMVRFVHPLYRSAVYDGIGPVRRRDLHLAAAAITDRTDALRHRVAAATGPDDQLSAELADAAAAASDAAMAGQLLVAAADVCQSPADRGTHLIAAGQRYVAAGLISSLRRIVPKLESLDASLSREVLLAALELEAGDVDGAGRRLRDAIADATDTERRAEAYIRLAELNIVHGQGQLAVDAVRAGFELEDLPIDLRHWGQGIAAVGMAQVHGGPAGLDALARQFDLALRDDDDLPKVALWGRATLEAYSGHEPAAARWFARAIAAAPRVGITRYLTHMHTGSARAHHAIGDWDGALRHAHLAHDLAVDHDQVWILAVAQSMAAQAHAALGEWDRADACLADAVQLSRAVPTAEAVNVTAIARGHVAQARNQPGEIVDAIAPITAREEAMLPLFSLQFVPMLVRALIDVGRLDDAVRELAQLERGVERRGLRLDAQVAALHGAVAVKTGDGAAALSHYQQARSMFEPNTPLLDQILTLHAGGVLMLQLGQRAQALGWLREARLLAASSRAAPYVERIDLDLHEAGLRSASGDRSPFDLTDRERDVAVQVARGLTNKEVAAALYVSSKAVEYHLGNIYAKFGINSRRQLRDRIAAD